MLQTVRGDKVDEKNRIICLVSMFPSWLWFLIVEKSVFLQFCTDPERNLILLQQFTYTHLKVLITVFQKMIWFIGILPFMRY